MKEKAIYPALLVLILSCLCAGCGTTDPVTQRETLGYVPARFYDFLDIMQLNLGIDSNVSLFASVAVEPIALGGGLYESQKVGMDGRKVGQWKETRAEMNLAIESYVRYEKVPNWGNRYLKDAFYSPHKNVLKGKEVFYEEWGFSHRLWDHENRFLDISAEVHLIALGLDIGVSLVETLDFIAGLIGLDVISDDDWYQPVPERKVPFFGEEEESEEDAVVPADS